ncbi:hypothetical protein [Streptomyces sp. NPDC048639]|uniref:hypothetical protein n=1 Tax=Streptomyces sp. NPDC048639 TaxID=3365581 RepID=UPI0037201497
MTTPPASGGHSGRYEDVSHYTVFNAMRGEELKTMLDGAKVSSVKEVARHWQVVHDELVGEDGKGGIKKSFDDAVQKVLKTWHGKSADKFWQQAQKISGNFERGAPYAQDVANAMGQSADDLQKALDGMGGIDWSAMRGEGSAQEQAEQAIQAHIEHGGGQLSYEYVRDQEGDSDDKRAIMVAISPVSYFFTEEGNLKGKIESYNGVQADLKSGMSTEAVLKKWDGVRGDLGLPKFVRQDLESAVVMEKLGTSYVTQSSKLKTPVATKDGEIPERPNGGGNRDTGGIGGGGIGGGVGGIGGGGAKMPRRGGIGVGGRDPIKLKPPVGKGTRPGSQIGTGLDSVTDGSQKPGSGGGSLGVGSGGGGGGIGGGGAGGGSMPIGGAASIGGGRTGTSGTGRTSGTGTGKTAVGSGGTGKTGATSGTGSGRAGMMPGMAGGQGAGGAGQGGGAGRGGSSMARRAGGVVGSAGGRASSGMAQGGSGLHRSRGGSEAGQSRGGRGMGAAGAPGAAGANAGKDGKGGQRPDYLTEEEETWLPQRNVAPRVIE